MNKKIIATIVGLSMAAVFAVAIDAQAYTGIPAGFSFTKNLSSGMHDPDVVNLKTVLANEGCVSGLANTDYFASKTKAGAQCLCNKYKSEISTAAGYTVGCTGLVGTGMRNKLNALIGGETPVAPGAAMSVTLAYANPVGANLWRGTANNAVLKVTLVGGTTAVNVTGLTLTSYGTTEATGNTDLSAIKVFDENNIQVGTDRTIAGNKVFFVFVPAVNIAANGSRTITIAVNVGTSAAVMAQAQFGIAAAADITGGTFTGTFPVRGNAFTIVPAGSIGSLAAGDYSTVPKTAVKIGEVDVVLDKITVSSGANEDVAINQITVTNSTAATISDNDITNIRIREVGGAVVAGPATLLSKKATFNFATPVLLTKGTAKNFEIVADIVSGENRTIEFNIAAGGVVGKGQLSGANILSTGASTAETVTIGAGTLTVTMSNNHPQGASALLIKTANRKALAVFSVRAIGENIILNTIDLNFNGTNNIGSTNYLSSVGLYDGDVLISNLQNIAVETDTTFTLNFTIPANTTRDLSVKALTNTLGSDSSYSLVTTWSAYTGYGLSSGKALTSTADTGTSAITIYGAGTATLAQDVTKTPANQGILSPTNNIAFGALKVFAQREDQKLKRLVVTSATSSGTGLVSTLTLYGDDGTTQLSNPVAPASNVFTFTTTDLLQDVVFTKAVYKTILIKGNVPSTADPTTGFYFTIATGTNQFVTSGLDSGSDFDGSALPSFDFRFSSPFAGGTYSMDKTIVEIKKNASSPSGAVSRGSYVTYAAWDVNNMSSDLGAAAITIIKFTSKTGIPAGAVAADFRLYDELGALISTGATTTVSTSTGQVQFELATALTVNFGAPKVMYLRIDTTSTTKWPTNQQMQWTILVVGDVTVTGGFAGFGGTVYSIPADTNIVQLP